MDGKDIIPYIDPIDRSFPAVMLGGKFIGNRIQIIRSRYMMHEAGLWYDEYRSSK